MRIASTILFLFLTLPTYATPNVHTGAQPDWLVPGHPDLTRQPPAEEISDGYYYELDDLQVNLILHTEYTHFIKHIINATGVQGESEISVTFSPQFQQVVFHRICILRNDGILDQLKPSRIKIVQEETDASDFEYNGLKRAFLTLTDVRKGDRIEVAYSIIGFNPVFGKKYSARQYFTHPTAICNYSRSIISTPDRPLHIITRNNAPAPTEQRIGGRLIYQWIDPPLKDDDDASDTPSWYNSLPLISVTEYKDWHEVVDWGLTTFNHYQFSLPAPLLEKMAAWRKSAAGNKDVFANLATRFVQNDIRYLGLEIGENTHRPHPPADVFNGRFGDCKDKALLLSVILQKEDIPAYATLINTTEGPNLPITAPSPRVFDHVIVAIHRPDSSWLYIDPTLSDQRGELSELYIPDYGYTLLLRDGEDSLRTVPPARINEYHIVENLNAKYYDSSRFTVNTTYIGGAADKVRRMYEEESRKDIEDGYLKYYFWLTGVLRERPLGYSDDSLRNELTIKEFYSVPNLWTIDKNDKRSFDFMVKMIRDYLPDPPEGKSGAPLALGNQVRVHYTLNIDLPEEWTFTSGPLHLRNKAYEFDFKPLTHGKLMTLSYTLTTFADHIDSASIPQYRKDYKEMDDRLSFSLYKESNTSTESIDSQPIHPLHPCWPAIWLTFFYALLFSRLFIYLNTRSADNLYAAGAGYPLGGWLLILGLSIGAGLFLDIWQLFRANFYSADNWIAWSGTGGTGLQYLYLGQLVIQLNFIAGAGAVMFWFLKKRDIFPRMFVWYAAIVLAGRLALIGLFYSVNIPDTLAAYRSDLPWAFVRTSVYATIWVTYVLRSGQVKNTFLEPFR
jgi:Domain of Unknown Function with PDB structure (DUF3857)/Protein of unknown function (DUF2569)